TGADATEARALELVRGFAGADTNALVAAVTTANSHDWNEGPWSLESDSHTQPSADQLPWKVTVYDFGVPRSLLRDLVAKGCQLTVVPAGTPASEVLAQKPDGVVLSSGPGEASACSAAIATVQQLQDAGVPLFGVGLG